MSLQGLLWRGVDLSRRVGTQTTHVHLRRQAGIPTRDYPPIENDPPLNGEIGLMMWPRSLGKQRTVCFAMVESMVETRT